MPASTTGSKYLPAFLYRNRFTEMKRAHLIDPEEKIRHVIDGEDRLLTVKEVAQMLNTSTYNVRLMILAGDLFAWDVTATKKRPKYRVPRSSIEAYLLRRVV